jgi:hypothetical protein
MDEHSVMSRTVTEGRGSAHPVTVVAMTIAPGAIANPPPDDDLVLRLAAAAYLGRYVGISRPHTESDLKLFFTWCTDQDIGPLVIQRAQIERYVRWMQEVRRFKPSTVSRRMAVVTGFYRTLRHRRRPGTLTRRLRPPATGAG